MWTKVKLMRLWRRLVRFGGKQWARQIISKPLQRWRKKQEAERQFTEQMKQFEFHRGLVLSAEERERVRNGDEVRNYFEKGRRDRY